MHTGDVATQMTESCTPGWMMQTTWRENTVPTRVDAQAPNKTKNQSRGFYLGQIVVWEQMEQQMQ